MLGQAVGRDQETMARNTLDEIGRPGSGRTMECDHMIE